MKSTNKFSNEQILAAKNKSIAGYLKSQNIEPVNMIGGELVYLSPLRSETTPSFYVNPQKNIFNDFGGTDEMRGDSIRLVQQFRKCNFTEAIEILLGSDFLGTYSFSFSGLPDLDKQDSRIQIKSVHKLKNSALIRYVTSRGILLQHAFDYLSEVHYEVDGKQYFAVGFKNDSDGFELRNSLGFKGKSDNGITIIDLGTESVSLFEGSFDFLSALRHFGTDKPTITAIILNTTNNLRLALPVMSNCKMINCYLDNDLSGEKAVQKLIKHGFLVKDWSKIIYPNDKDFNEYLINNRNKAV
ncbi:CHC2 zinc finger domain-containing protein [Dyadobacter sp. NIV53]|uniref:CHC2 zinc finger domain-containing protein n=1 Tax=Dyadobacter sp. NIV53 TaxID=2861765 RepID=UPI001C880EE3|nr:CHC2 zinc finger domain-containing protein [Dyadobacter sp. NIV53]